MAQLHQQRQPLLADEPPQRAQQPLWTHIHKKSVYSVAISHDGTMLASGSIGEEGQVDVYDTFTRQKVVESLKGSAVCLLFGPDNTLIIGGYGFHFMICTWSLATTPPTLLQTLKGHKSYINSIALHPDGVTLASGDHEGVIRLWNIKHGTALCSLALEDNAFVDVYALAFSADGLWLASGGKSQNICIWDTTTHALFAKLLISYESSSSYCLAYSPDGRMLASGSGKNVRIYDAVSHEHLETLEGYISAVNALAFTPDSCMIISASDDKTIRGWDLAQRDKHSKLQMWKGHIGPVRCVAISPDGSWFVSGGGRDDGSVRIWELRPSKAVFDHIKPVCRRESNDDDEEGS